MNKYFMRMCFLISSLLISLSAQTVYSLNKNTALTAAAEVITVQQPAAGTSNSVLLVSAYVDSTVACTFTIERNGSAATTTTLTPAQVNPQLATIATAQGFSSSNVGVGTVLGKVNVAANGWFTFDLSDIKLPSGNDNTQNFTVRSSAVTGTVNIIIKWKSL